MNAHPAHFGALILGMLLVSSSAPAPADSGDREQRATASVQRTLVMISAGELPSFADKKMLPTGQAASVRTGGEEILNAKLVFKDEVALPRPFLAEALPELSTDT